MERAIAIFTLVLTLPYFVLETWHFVLYGSSIPMVVVDYILMSLFVMASYVSLSNKWESGAGLLCGAWGFALCLNWRSFFWRWEELKAQQLNVSEPIEQVASVLGVTLILSAVMFALTLKLAWPKRA